MAYTQWQATVRHSRPDCCPTQPTCAATLAACCVSTLVGSCTSGSRTSGSCTPLAELCRRCAAPSSCCCRACMSGAAAAAAVAGGGEPKGCTLTLARGAVAILHRDVLKCRLAMPVCWLGELGRVASRPQEADAWVTMLPITGSDDRKVHNAIAAQMGLGPGNANLAFGRCRPSRPSAQQAATRPLPQSLICVSGAPRGSRSLPHTSFSPLRAPAGMQGSRGPPSAALEEHLVACVQHSLSLGLHDNSAFLAERLVAQFPSEVGASDRAGQPARRRGSPVCCH